MAKGQTKSTSKVSAGSSSPRTNRSKKRGSDYRLKKVPAKTVNKWSSIPAPLQQTVLAMLEESMTGLLGCSQDPKILPTLDKIRDRVQRTLKKLKLPKERYMDIKSLKSSQKILATEKARLNELERRLEEELRCLQEQHKEM